MKLYQYDDIKKLNQALGSFAKNNVPIIKVDIVRLSIDVIEYFVLADPKEVFTMPIKVESKTEEEAKKTIKKVKKEEVKEEKKAK